MSDLYKQIANLPKEKRELLEQMLIEQGVDISEIMIIPQPRDTNQFPLSYSQQRLWFLDKFEPGSPLYNISSVLRLRGKLDIEALEKSFNEIVKRHEVLRTTFTEDNGEPFQIIAPELKVPLQIIHLEHSPMDIRDEELQKRAIQESLQPFNLTTGPLMRIVLLQFAKDDFALFLTMHHIVSDNWSTGLLVHEIRLLYSAFVENKQPELPELSIQYSDFAVWQRKWLSGKTLEQQLSYWQKKLSGSPPLLAMPLDKPRPAYQTFNGNFKLFTIPEELTQKLRELSQKHDVTFFMTLLAAFYILLHRYSGQDDICIGSPIANRNRKETENLIGFFVNNLVLRGELAGNPTVADFLQQVKETTLGAYDHQDLPFETLVEALQPERDMSYSPLFQVMFVLNNAPIDKLQLPDLEIQVLEIENKTAKYELILNVTENEKYLSCKLEYNTDLYLDSTMDRLIRHYLMILREIVKRPHARIGELSLLTDEEKNLVINIWSKPEKQYHDSRGIVQIFEEQVVTTPENTALRIANEHYSYLELNRRANQLARYLLKNNLKKGQIVGINADRSAEMLIAFLAVLKADGVYLPLDPDYPVERLEYMLNDAGAGMLLSKQSLKTKSPKTGAHIIYLDQEWADIVLESTENLNLKIHGDDVAYIIYTSGSTGLPKGVQVQHYALANHCLDMKDYYEIVPEDNVLQFAALNFDASIEQILTPLISGATVCMRDNEIWNSRQFAEKIAEYGLTVINPPTAYWTQVLKDWARNPQMIPASNLRLVIVGGDVFHSDCIANLKKARLAHLKVLNAYGPTETVITATTFQVPIDINTKTISIGRPRANRSVYVLDKYGNLTPPGVPGELYIGGQALAKGYLNRPDLTAERFITNPITREEQDRVYKTGDLVRFLSDGNLEFLGRTDYQVKVRGFRIELGEIEKVLLSLPQIENACVKVFEDDAKDKVIVGYYTTSQKTDLEPKVLRDKLREHLPDYMIPGVFVYLDEMPLTSIGKIDRYALKKPDLTKSRVSTEFVAPRTQTEETLANIVREVLNIDRVGVRDNFFELGGHSMLATQVVARIQEHFDVELSLRSLFEHPTVEGIAQQIAEIQLEGQDEMEIEKLLSELETLPDEEARKRLEENAVSQGDDPDENNRNGRPRNKLEEYLLELWKEALQNEDLTIQDNFFARGGNQEKAKVIIQRLEKDFNHYAPPQALMRAPTVAKFSAFMNEYYHDFIREKFGAITMSDNCLDEDCLPIDDAPIVSESDVNEFQKIIVPIQFDRKKIKQKNKRAIFVLSPPRSGSTLFRVMLNGHSKLFSPPEMDLLSFDTLNKRREFFENKGLPIWLQALPTTIKELYQCDENEALEIEKAFLLQDISTHECYQRLQHRLGDRLLVDKTPSYSLDKNILDRAEASFDEPLFIHLLRHPYGMIYSFIEAKLDENFFKFDHPFSRRQLAELIWIVSHKNVLKFFQNIPEKRKYTIRFEDLLTRPGEEMIKLCHFLHLDFEEAMLHPYSGDKMTKGFADSEQMVGDYKFYLYRKIDPRTATRWKKFHKKDFLSDIAVNMAKNFGYTFD